MKFDATNSFQQQITLPLNAISKELHPYASLIARFKNTNAFDTAQWRSICDVTLTLKQARKSDDGGWVRIDAYQCRQTFRAFINQLNRAVYGSSVRRHGKQLRVIPILEKSINGRWHYHVAIEPPVHIEATAFLSLIEICWNRLDWAYKEVVLRNNANKGWINYMLKSSQKSGHEAWPDCIDWNSFHNPVADA